MRFQENQIFFIINYYLITIYIILLLEEILVKIIWLVILGVGLKIYLLKVVPM